MYLPNEEFIKIHSLDYMEYMKKQPCCLTGQLSPDLHHLEAIGTRGKRYAPNQRHFTVIPLSRDKHSELHSLGVHKFQERYNIQLWQEAYYYFAKWLLVKVEKTEVEPNLPENDDEV